MLALATGQLPLFGVLGYELALVAALVASVAGLDLGAARVRHVLATAERGRLPAMHDLAIRAIGAVWIPLAIWAAIAAVRGLWTPTCDWGYGLLAFAALPLASGALAAMAGTALGLVIGPRPVWGTLAPLALALVLAAAGIARGLAEPPVFSYSALIGYFPGNLYDELIELSWPLAWARLEALAAAIAACGIAVAGFTPELGRWKVSQLWRGRRWRALVTAGLAAGAAATLASRSGALGYRPGAEDIEAALGGRLETAHFVIHYQQTPAVSAAMPLVARDHEFRLAQVVATLGVAPRAKIRSFYFADADTKARWIGARYVEMAKPWRKEIYLTHEAFPHPSLRHEIAHVVAGEFGDRWFRASTREVAGLPVLANPGLIEGLAVAADWPSWRAELSPHQATRALELLGQKPSLGALMSLRFLAVASGRGYTTAGSFARFLLETRGAPALRELYRSGGDFARAYGEPIEALERSWHEMLASVQVSQRELEVVRELYSRRAIFERPCPHATAARRAEAGRALARRDLGAAIAQLRTACSDAPEDPHLQLELASLLARGGPAERASAHASWRQLAATNTLPQALRAQVLEQQARAAGVDGALEEARALVEQALTLHMDDDHRRQLEAMRLALGHTGPAGPALRSYFFAPAGSDPGRAASEAVEREPTSGLARYLRGLRRADTGAWAEMAQDLDAGLRLGLPSPRFERNAARRLAVAAYRARDTGRLLSAIERLERPAQSEVDRLTAADWRARLRFDSTGRLD